ncbi:MAG: hypothetical protein ACE5GA_11080 [Candidatus Zixiibacteriota bacterium]
MVLALPVAALVGVISFAQYSGGVSQAAYGLSGWSNIKRIAVGIFLMIALLSLGFTLHDSSSDFLSSWGVVALALGYAYAGAAVLSGFGGVVLTRFGRREYLPDAGPAGAAELPPLPTPPPIPASVEGGTPPPPDPPSPPEATT